jgi:hypothetical protein
MFGDESLFQYIARAKVAEIEPDRISPFPAVMDRGRGIPNARRKYQAETALVRRRKQTATAAVRDKKFISDPPRTHGVSLFVGYADAIIHRTAGVKP